LARRPPELIELGRVAGSYGVRGWVKVAPQRGVADALVAAGEWWLGAEARRVEQAKVHSATVVAKLAGIETREQALALSSKIAWRAARCPTRMTGATIADLVGLKW
jgi:16S rRNA processing protein RimM